MQPQGLEALMPQGQAMPQMDNPRLAAAMDVVSSDAEEQILDPRTLAMLKYKDALQAMQAADQMMAAAQPAPTAPTVAERTKLAAEQGIAGLAQRLAPGVQQQGSQMAAQQAQQAQGGLPQLPAPNMAGMAGGGIVAFAKGGLPTAGARDKDEVVTYDELGNPIYASDIARALAAGTTDTSEEGAARRAAYAGLQAERPNLSEIARTPKRPSASSERVPSSTYGAGDRTGQGSTLAGMGSGVMSLLNDARNSVGRAAGKTIYDMINRPESAPEAAPVMGDAAHDMTRRPEAETKDLPLWKLRTRPLYDAGAEVKPPMSEADRIAESDAMIAEESAKPRGAVGDIGARFGLGDLAERAVQYAADNPAEAAGNVLLTASGAGLGLRLLGVGATKGFSLIKWLAKNPTVSAALSGLALKYGDSVYKLAQDAAAGDENAAAELEKAGQSQATPTAAPASPTAPSGAAAAPAPDAVETLLSQPSPREVGPNATPEQYFRSQFRPEKKAETPAAQATAAPQSRDDRMRTLIAGLRGFGAQGLGGFAAGSAEEEMRMEQEAIAEQERKRAAAAETRQLDLEERGLTQRDAILRMEVANKQQEAKDMMDLRYMQLAATHGEAVADAINEKTALYMPRAIELRTVLADPSYETGWFGNREELEAELAKLEATISATEAEVTALFGPAPASPTGTGATSSGGLNPDDFTVRPMTQ